MRYTRAGTSHDGTGWPHLAELAGSRDTARAASATRPPALRALFIALGSLFVAIGVLGVFLPLLPATVFFLLAAACYARGSERAHRWLMTNRFFGRRLRDYREARGATALTKAVTIVALWAGLGVSAWLLGPPAWVYPAWAHALLAAVGVGVTAHMLRLRTLPR